MEDTLFRANQLCFLDTLCFIDLKIPNNKVTFVSGPSGTGKSTLLKLLNATYQPTHGTIYFHEQELSTLDTIKLRKKVLLVGQSVFLFDGSIRENFQRFYALREEAMPNEEEMNSFLQLCKVPFTLDDTVVTMSGGERQRVYLAIFLSFPKEVLMLDEPTSALDAANAQLVMQNIISFCKQKQITVIAVSHDPSLAEAFAENEIKLTRVSVEDFKEKEVE